MFGVQLRVRRGSPERMNPSERRLVSGEGVQALFEAAPKIEVDMARLGGPYWVTFDCRGYVTEVGLRGRRPVPVASAGP